MICAGWIRFRASLMAMRWFLPWFGVSFFWAVADWRDVGSPPSWRRRASPWKRGDASHARICSRCDRARTRFSQSQSCPRSPIDGHGKHFSPAAVYSRCMPDLVMTNRKIANSLFSRVANSSGVDGMTCAPPDAKRSFTSDESRALTTSALSLSTIA